MNGEDFLDGFRYGLGRAISRIETVANKVPEPCEPEAVEAILRGIAAGLRTISASATIEAP